MQRGHFASAQYGRYLRGEITLAEYANAAESGRRPTMRAKELDPGDVFLYEGACYIAGQVHQVAECDKLEAWSLLDSRTVDLFLDELVSIYVNSSGL
jgi:hypothetical protein